VSTSNIILIFVNFFFIELISVVLRFGYVEFADTNAAQEAMNLYGTEICGRTIYLDFTTGRSRNNSSKKYYTVSFYVSFIYMTAGLL
jgi:RNA recognition motif-containing protein